MHKLLFALVPCLSLSAIVLQPGDFGQQVSPWLGNQWEFELTPAYTYSWFTTVQNGSPQPPGVSHDQLLTLDLAFVPLEAWETDLEVEFADTPTQEMGYRGLAFQIRHQFLNDIMGDLLSFTAGASIRGVSRRGLSDVSCPYASDVNFELNASLGKEWDHGEPWRFRAFGFGALGQANHGSPWLRFFASLEGEQMRKHQLGLFLDGYFGFGSQTTVYTNHFHGYGKIYHQSLDVGARYAYVFDVWGTLALSYARRVYALSFPEAVNYFTLSYTLPFSVF